VRHELVAHALRLAVNLGAKVNPDAARFVAQLIRLCAQFRHEFVAVGVRASFVRHVPAKHESRSPQHLRQPPAINQHMIHHHHYQIIAHL
jgi:hypothetical protein